MTSQSDYDHSLRKLHLLLKIHRELLEGVLPAIKQAVDNATEYMSDPEDDEEITDYLHELATETLIDELVKLLTRDEEPVSAQYSVRDIAGIDFDTVLACYDEIKPESAKRWFAASLHISPEEYNDLQRQMPSRLSL